ncbi:MAG: FAD-dependent oxidoreductase [Bdellovibrionales bacterium]
MGSVIVGGGLTGLLIAHRLHTKGHKVTLLEKQDFLGGSLRRPNVNLFPATDSAVGLMEWLKSLAPLPVNFSVAEHRPQIFEEGRWRPFAGFLDAEFKSLNELSHISAANEIRLEPSSDQIVRMLVEQLPLSAQCQTEVTQIRCKDGRVEEVVLNGDKSLRTEQLIFTGNPQELNRLIDGESLPPKYRTRLAKMAQWTSVTLELSHPEPLSDSDAILVFGSSSKEFEPVFGRVVGTTSRWMTLVHSERSDEHDFTGQCLRHIKRQLKRAWPQLFDNPLEEKILVQAEAFGQHSLKTRVPWQIPELSNLFIGGPTLAEAPGWLGSVESARGILALLTPEPESDLRPQLDH